MKTAKQSKREAKQLFRLCVVDGRLDENRARLVVRKVLQARRRGYLSVMARFQHLVKLDCARHTAAIESAMPLPADLEGRVRAGLEQSYGSGITPHFAHNPALIGGMRIQVGSDVYDSSVQSALLALERSF